MCARKYIPVLRSQRRKRLRLITLTERRHGYHKARKIVLVPHCYPGNMYSHDMGVSRMHPVLADGFPEPLARWRSFLEALEAMWESQTRTTSIMLKHRRTVCKWTRRILQQGLSPTSSVEKCQQSNRAAMLVETDEIYSRDIFPPGYDAE
jgi:hypothetical protein